VFCVLLKSVRQRILENYVIYLFILRTEKCFQSRY
jgi:hypothetical protein